MGVRVRSEEERWDEAMKTVIVKFKSEYDKWTVLRNKYDLREIEEVFLTVGSVERGAIGEKVEYVEETMREKI